MNEEQIVEQVISKDGKLVLTTAGVSMKPLLGNRRDTVIIFPPQGRLKKYDVALYRNHGKLTLHRVVKVLSDSYVICGDNCIAYEYGIRDKDIIGCLSAFYRKGKYYTVDNRFYRIYSVCVVKTFLLRKLYAKARLNLARIYRKVFPKK